MLTDYVKKAEEILLDMDAPIKVRSYVYDELRKKTLHLREMNTKSVMESGRIEIFKKLKVPERKIEIEMSEYGGTYEAVPFFLAKPGRGVVLRILFHDYPEAKKSEDGKTYVVTDDLIENWLNEGYTWFHVEDMVDLKYETFMSFLEHPKQYNYLYSSNVPKEIVLENPGVFIKSGL